MPNQCSLVKHPWNSTCAWAMVTRLDQCLDHYREFLSSIFICSTCYIIQVLAKYQPQSCSIFRNPLRHLMARMATSSSPPTPKREYRWNILDTPTPYITNYVPISKFFSQEENAYFNMNACICKTRERSLRGYVNWMAMCWDLRHTDNLIAMREMIKIEQGTSWPTLMAALHHRQ